MEPTEAFIASDTSNVDTFSVESVADALGLTRDAGNLRLARCIRFGLLYGAGGDKIADILRRGEPSGNQEASTEKDGDTQQAGR